LINLVKKNEKVFSSESENELWDHYNSLLLSTDISRIRKLITRYDLFRKSLNVPGDVVECGVFKGTGLMYWLKLLEIYSPASQKRIIGFDTFDGFADSLVEFEKPSAEKYVDESNYEGIDPDWLMSQVSSMGLGEKVELVKGDVVKTAAEYVQNNPGFRVSMLHLDLDTYSGTKAVLEAFYPVVSRKGVIILDEYGVRGWGESDAVDEFFDKKKVTIQSVPNAVTPTAYVIKD
tara:strand:- start:198 stop:896 length:699 start_codon:yes stop_codon:yes gene_type:complete